MKPRSFQAKSHSRRAFTRYIHNHQVLRVGGPKFAIPIALSQIGCRPQLLRIDASTQHCRAHIKKAWLFLPMHANMVAKHIVGRLLQNSWSNLYPSLRSNSCKNDSAVQPCWRNKILQAGALAIFPQTVRIAKNFSHGLAHRNTCSHRTKALSRTAKCGSVESPPPTRRENPILSSRCFRTAV